MRFSSLEVPDGVWKLVDFGSSVAFGSAITSHTMAFGAPEITVAIRERKVPVAAAAADIFSLGMLYHWMVAPISPWGEVDEGDYMAISKIHLSRRPFDLEAHGVPEGPPRNLLRKLLNQRPKDRMTLKEFFVSEWSK